MIVTLLFIAISSVTSIFTKYLPLEYLDNGVSLKLPWGIDDIFVQGISGYKVLSTAFPPFTIVLQAFLIYLGFRIALRLLKGVPLLGRTLERN